MRAAADQLGMAVSSVSRQISQLEAELGVTLIEHGRRQIKLTEAGELLIEYHGEQLAHREAFEARLADLKGLRTGHIDLAIGEGFIGAPLSKLLARFAAKHAGLLVNVHMTASSSEVARRVVEDEAHLGLAFQSSDNPRIRVIASVRHPLCAIVRPAHPLAQSQSVTIADLAEHPMCLPDSSFRTRQLLKAAEAAERVSLQPGITSNSIVLLKGMLRSADLFTLLPMLAVIEEVERGEFVAVPVNSAALQDTAVHLISRLGRHLPPAPLRLMNSLMSYLNGYERCAERTRAPFPLSDPAPAPARLKVAPASSPPLPMRCRGDDTAIAVDATK
ncbi:MAG: LysR family transcriptional regulator [Gammaproteobacteria bacterium]|nr:LysR family transcriptional regulator [Gammaproteobacteria bacterium]